MKKKTKMYIGMDVHKDSVMIAVLPEGVREPTLVRRLSHELSMGIENGTLSGIENGTLREGARGGSVATGAGAFPESRRLTIRPHSGLSRRPPLWTRSGGWPSTVPYDAASGNCCPGC